MDFSNEMFPLPALDEQDEIDLANEETLFQHEQSSDTIIERCERGQLYAKSPTCSKCKETISSVEEALLISRADGSFALTHFSQDCYSEEIAAMTLRHIANGRLRWTERPGIESQHSAS